MEGWPPNRKPARWPIAIGKMEIDAREEALLEAFRRLPPSAAVELSAVAQRLAALAPDTTIDWSDSWSDADLREFTAASLRRFEDEEEEEPR